MSTFEINESNLTEEELETLNNLIKKTKDKTNDFPTMFQPYWYVDEVNMVEETLWNNYETDKRRFDCSNCFLVKEEAEKEAEKRRIKEKLKKFAKENNEYEIDWNNFDKNKYFLIKSATNDLISIDWNIRNIMDGVVYFTSFIIAEKAIEEIGEENLKKLFD